MKKVILLCLLVLGFLFFRVTPAKAIDPGCSVQTPECFGTAVVDLFWCKPPVGTVCPGEYLVMGVKVNCDSDCKYQICSSNDLPLGCWYDATGNYCRIGNYCTTAGNCCWKGSATPTPTSPPCTPSNPDAPSLSSPADEATGLSINVNLTWNPIGNWGTSCAGSQNYEVYIATGRVDPTGLLATVPNGGTTSTSFWGTPATTYSWKVVANNGSRSVSSPIWHFTTQDPVCNVSLDPSSSNVLIGNTQALTATVTSNSTITGVAFSSSNTAVATISPASDATSTYNTTATALSNGTTTITALATMSAGGTCSDTATITVPECTLTLDPASLTMALSDPAAPFTATVSNINLSGTSVSFVSSNTSVITVNPALDASSPYATSVTPVGGGTSILTATALRGGVAKCFDTAIINVAFKDAWWQVQDADVSTNGDLYSAVP